MYLRRTPSAPAAAQEPAAVAPAQAAEVPAQVEPPPAAAAPREVADTAPREVADTTRREVADAKPATRAPKDSQARRDEGAPVRARDEGGRGDDLKDFEDEDRRDRERGKGRGRRRGRGADAEGAEAEKEMRKVLKRAKDKAPRLVDVLVNPGN
jgi:hypothetical protein